MFKRLRLEHYVFTGGALLTIIILSIMVSQIKHEESFNIHPLSVIRSPATIDFVEQNLYIHSVRYNRHKHEIEYTLTNTSYFWYSFGQIQKAFKQIGSEWYAIVGLVDVHLPLNGVPPNSSIERSFWLGAFHSFRNITLPSGIYLFKKPLYHLIHCEYEGSQLDVTNPSWLHLILEVDS